MLREFQTEIQRLKEQLEQLEAGEGGAYQTGDDQEEQGDSEDDDGSDVSEADETAASMSTSKQSPRSKKKRASSLTEGDAARRASETRQMSDQKIKELQEQIDRDRTQLLQSKDVLEAERQKTLDMLQQRANDLERERQAREQLAQRLAEMQAKLLVGGENLLDKSAQHEEELARQAAELEERQRLERELQRSLEEQEDLHFQIEESYSSLQEEAQEKTVKLKKLWTMLMKHKSEINDAQEEFFRQKEELLQTIDDLSSELKMKSLIVDTYVPTEYLHLIEEHATYDPDLEQWRIAGMENDRPPREVRKPPKNRSPFVELYSNPAVLFPDMFLSYDMFIAGIKKSTGAASTRKPSTVQDPRKQTIRKERSRNSLKPTDGEARVPSEAPAPRGLVSNSKRYA